MTRPAFGQTWPARPARRTWLARTWPAIHRAGKAGAPDPRRLVPGGVHHCRCPGSAVVLWRRGHADCRPLGAAARFNAIIVAGKSAVRRAIRSIYRSSGRGGGSASASNTTASNILAQAAPQDAAPTAPQRFPIRRSCCKRSRAISRTWSEPSNSSRRTSNKSPVTIQKPLGSSRRARKR